MPLEILIQQSVGAQTPATITVKLAGSLDTATSSQLERQLAPLIAGPVNEFIFDLRDLRYISSAGLRVFANVRKTARSRGGQASFLHMQPQIQEVFEIMKSLPGVAVFENMAELDKYLAARQKSHDPNA